MKLALIVLTALLSHQSAQAQVLMGRELRVQVEAAQQIAANPKQGTISMLSQAQAGMGFVQGVSDSLAIALPACQPANASPGQKVAIVAKFMRERPETWSEPAVAIVLTALKEAFGCTPKEIK